MGNIKGAIQNRGLFDRKCDLYESNVFGRGKYAEFRELSLKIYEMIIQPVT